VSVELRSARWFGTQDVAGLIHCPYLKAEGISQAAIQGRPIVGESPIRSAWSAGRSAAGRARPGR
jgi:hypothetical protein